MKFIPKLEPVFTDKLEQPHIRTGPGGISVPVEGSPLEHHPLWSVVHGTPPSKLGWKERGLVIVAQPNPTAEVINLAYRDLKGVAATIRGEYLFDAPDDDYWTLPFAKFVDLDNLVGVRRRGGQLECVQKVNGTWQTIATIAGVALGDWEVHITPTDIQVYINGNLKLSELHDIDGEGWFGISAHKWPSGDDVDMVREYRVNLITAFQIPCMTSDTQPYGLCGASHVLENFAAWKGFNCSANHANDAWITPTDLTEPPWVQWFWRDAPEPMQIYLVKIKPRAGMSSSWYASNNPSQISFYGLRKDGAPVLMSTVDTSGWDNGNERSFYLDWNGEPFYGLRISIDKTAKSETDGTFHTAIGWAKAYGRTTDLKPRASFKFRFTDQCPNPTVWRLTYTDGQGSFWIDGTEYSSGQNAELTPDDGSVEHVVEYELDHKFSVFKMGEYIAADIEQLNGVEIERIEVYGGNLTGDLDTIASSPTLRALFVGGSALTGNIENWTSPLFSLRLGNDPPGIIGDVGKTQFKLTDWCYMPSTGISGDIFQAGWEISSHARFSATGINQCSGMLDGWTTIDIDFVQCPLDQQSVDNILVSIDNNGQIDGVLKLQDTAPPSSVGMNAIASLESRGWTITYDEPLRLTVNIQGGDGIVEDDLGGISCPDDCEEYYDTATTVTLTATPAQGYLFDRWEGDTTDGTVVVDGDRSVTAVFRSETPQYTLTVNTGNGTVTDDLGQISCPSDCEGLYDEGTTVTLTPAADSGYEFSHWEGDTTDGTVVMDGDKTVTAVFTEIPTETCPIEDHPDWTLHSGVTGPTSFCIDDSGLISYQGDGPQHGIVVRAEGENGRIECVWERGAWSHSTEHLGKVPLVKYKDNDNYAYMYVNKNGHWYAYLYLDGIKQLDFDLSVTAAQSDAIALELSGNKVRWFVNGTERKNYDAYSLVQNGSWGIMDGSDPATSDKVPFISGFTHTPLAGEEE